MLTKREQILSALGAWIRHRPGLEYGNYCSGWNDKAGRAAYFSEMRSITRDRHTAERLLGQVAWRESIGEAELREAFRSAYSGRLSIIDKPDGSIALDYCTGQYWPTEYRKAACAILASALWAHKRACVPEGLDAPGTWMRKEFRKEYGASIANRWFN
jgi:hypothetical protein